MKQVHIIGIDLAKQGFQLHGARSDGSVAFRKKLTRGKVLGFLALQPRCQVAMEACGSAHYWGREIGELGHEVKIMPPLYVKAYVKRQKNATCGAQTSLPGLNRPRRFPEQRAIGPEIPSGEAYPLAWARSHVNRQSSILMWRKTAINYPRK